MSSKASLKLEIKRTLKWYILIGVWVLIGSKETALVCTFFDYHSSGGTRGGWGDPRQVLFLQCPIEN